MVVEKGVDTAHALAKKILDGHAASTVDSNSLRTRADESGNIANKDTGDAGHYESLIHYSRVGMGSSYELTILRKTLISVEVT